MYFFCYRILNFFNTTSDEYSVVFTSGCTAALKLLAETFLFGNDTTESNKTDRVESGCFCYLLDNHTSVQGMREIAIEKRAKVMCLQVDQLRQVDVSMCFLQSQGRSSDLGNSLFAYPAQSNFSGHRYPLGWVNDVKSKKFPFQRDFSDDSWFICLDAASFVSTSPLDMTVVKPDFLALSFYKIFGYPTGLGKSIHFLFRGAYFLQTSNVFLIISLSVDSIFTNICAYIYIYILHTHTHTHIYIYIYIYIFCHLIH